MSLVWQLKLSLCIGVRADSPGNTDFLDIAGEAYCPGKPGLAGSSTLWSIFPFIVGVGRAWIGVDVV